MLAISCCSGSEKQVAQRSLAPTRRCIAIRQVSPATACFLPLPSPLPSSYRVHIWYGQTRMTGLQSREGRMMIGSVV